MSHWERSNGNRPRYVRRDGFVVVMDGPARWGILAPDSGFDRITARPSAEEAMEWVDTQHPLEGA